METKQILSKIKNAVKIADKVERKHNKTYLKAETSQGILELYVKFDYHFNVELDIYLNRCGFWTGIRLDDSLKEDLVYIFKIAQDLEFEQKNKMIEETREANKDFWGGL